MTGSHWGIAHHVITGKELPFFITFIEDKVTFLSHNLFQIILLNAILSPGQTIEQSWI